MTITFDEDIILPIVVAVSSVLFVIGYETLVPRSSIDQLLDENAALFSEVSQANHEISILTKELDSYHVTIQELEALGASHTQAIQIIKASEVYSLDSKL